MSGLEEISLRGGFTNAGQVSRVGDTVRRPWRSTSPATHALLEHLDRAGFDGAPRFLGVDEQGREVLSYVEGEAAIEPLPEWAFGDAAMVSVAELLRRYHDGVASFDPSPYTWPSAVPAAFRGGIVTHNDPNLDNVVFAGGRAVALLDFDLAGPACTAWDVACAARLWAPLRDESDTPGRVRGLALARLRTFVDAYELPRQDRARVVDAMVDAHEWCYDIVREAVANGHDTFERIWREGGRTRAERTVTWLAAHGAQMREALTHPAS